MFSVFLDYQVSVFLFAWESHKFMNVSLTPELETLVYQKVQTGLYNSASEVVREALRLMAEQDAMKELRRDELRREIMKGVEDIQAGRFIKLETDEDFSSLAEIVKQEGRQKLANQRNDQSSR